MKRRSFLLFLTLYSSLNLLAQDRPIGYWRSLLPYNTPTSIATDGSRIFVSAGQAFYTYNAASGEISTYSKVEGMNDIHPVKVTYDAVSNTTVLGYSNSNIDLFKDESFYNIPYLKLKTVTGTKNINDIYTKDGLAFLSTDIGVLVLNLEKQEVKETYVFLNNGQTVPVYGFTVSSNYYYAATGKGLYRTSVNNPNPQNFNSWQGLDTVRAFHSIALLGDSLAIATTDTLFLFDGAGFIPKLSVSTIKHLDAGTGRTLLSAYHEDKFYGTVMRLNNHLDLIDSSRTDVPFQTIEVGSELYTADNYKGLAHFNGLNDYSYFNPNGPKSYSSFDILPMNGDVWIAHGGRTGDLWFPVYSQQGISHLSNNSWRYYAPDNFPLFAGDSVYDFLYLAKDPANGTLYAGTYSSGLLQLKADGSARILKAMDGLYPIFNVPGQYPVTGLAYDSHGNLWFNQLGATHELGVLTPEGNMYNYQVSLSRPFPFAAAGVIVDQNDLKWYYGPQSSGVVVYNDNGTLENANDDSYRQLSVGAGSGGLPTNFVNCVVADRDGSIWIGTADGIGVVSCPSLVISHQCEATRPIVQYDQFADYLFHYEFVNTIAVDGANRKWIGTNNGVWLVSPEGDQQIERFTVDNSPLPSNVIQKIAVDPVTGDVYIGTDQGLVSYRGTATEGGETNSGVLVFPNPVTSGYNGPVAIRGLVTDADVRITDINGQLVYRTKATGGEAVWNGVDYKGHRPQSGVYLIFISNTDGTQHFVGKMIFME